MHHKLSILSRSGLTMTQRRHQLMHNRFGKTVMKHMSAHISNVSGVNVLVILPSGFPRSRCASGS
jgi:hypothetical protein